jgi:hypothetical protein
VYQAPEVEHLQRAVDAVKRALLPEKEKEPDNEPDNEPEETAEQAGK